MFRVHTPARFARGVVAGFLAVQCAKPQAASADPVAAAIVAGSLTHGATQDSLTGGEYADETNKLGDWPLTTGSFGGSTFAISLSNANFNGNGFGGTPDTMVAFGNGGGVTL